MIKLKSPSLKAVLAEAAEGCIMDCQGNSGTILTFYFSTLAEAGTEALGQRAALPVVEWAQVLDTVGKKMLGAVANPKEGTVITVIADTCARCRLPHRDIDGA